VIFDVMTALLLKTWRVIRCMVPNTVSIPAAWVLKTCRSLKNACGNLLQLGIHLPIFVLNGLVIAGYGALNSYGALKSCGALNICGALKIYCISLSTTAVKTKAILPPHNYTELKDQLHAPATLHIL